MAIENQILETDIVGASDVVYYVQGKVKFKDFTGVGKRLLEKCGSQANVFGGFLSEDNGSDSCTVTVIATGLQPEDTPIIRRTSIGQSLGTGASVSSYEKKPVAPSYRPSPVSQVRKPVARNEASIIKKETPAKITVPTFVKKTNREE